MLKSHERFHSANGKRLILVADDEFVNREIMRGVLEDEYELIFAENGQQTLDEMRANRDTLSLVLLDLMMPVLDGMEALRQAQSDPAISHIPVIVITSDQDAEVESLTVGASDFIPKPYPRANVIKARVRRTIELSEDRQIISSTERDSLTGLYNREYFYRYVEQFDQHHKNLDMDAIVVDVNHFHMINERFGTAHGDSILKSIGEALVDFVRDGGGLVCRREADTFLIYCPHGIEHSTLLESASSALTSSGEDDADVRVWLRMGVYASVDKDLDVERRFDRAKMAADTVQGSFARNIGIYDSAMHERELFSEQLIEEFATGVKERQFQIHYQPKFDVRPVIPVLASAEALVRWEHPKLGMISPGVFIPLFEENGLIQQLDLYVWREAASKIKEWKDRFGFAVPVSVNVSRIDMYDPHLVDTLEEILDENGISANELLLEITESAYTQDSKQIVETVGKLRSLGFQVEMDDFGTGYSSLNMISSLPVDALKLDMQFIRSAFAEGGDSRMLEIIIDIAEYLGVPVIAEGVETEEQMMALKGMGCDYVQGYYFSRPVPAHEYEKFVIERIELDERGIVVPSNDVMTSGISSYRDITQALSSGFESIYYVDINTDHYIEFNANGKREDLQIESSGENFFGDMRDALRKVCPEDETRVVLSLKKETLLAQLAGTDPFFMTYRALVGGKQVFYNLKAVRAHTHDNHHIVIGISNVDSQLRQLDAGQEAESGTNELDFASLAKALSNDVESVYYIDIESDTYQEYKADSLYKLLQLEMTGSDFFAECNNNIGEVVYPDDRDRVAGALSKEALVGTLRESKSMSLLYRLIINGGPQYYRLKAVWADGSNRHVIIGVSNVDSQIDDEARLEAQRRSGVTYASIVQALATDYFSIYYVNTITDNFIEYSADERYADLSIEKSGNDFFGQSRANIKRVVHPDDIDMVLSAFTKEKVLEALEHDRTFTLTYRLMFEDEPTYVHLKATSMEDRDDRHIVIGVSNVDEQIRREQEHARALRMANQDALTGVKSAHAYVADQNKIDLAIENGKQGPFAVAVCDVNGLKEINDTQGHSAGDRYIKDACAIVCRVFAHSPVYRIGGDEFVVILSGSDYAKRGDLIKMLAAQNDASKAMGGVLVAGGMSEFDPKRDDRLARVFERADAAMYENKKELKGE